MVKGLELYDYDHAKKDHPYNKEFRTKQVFFCYVCWSYANRAKHTTGRFASGLRAICPNEKENWHARLEDMLRWLVAHPHPKRYRRELEREIYLLRQSKIDAKGDARHDVVGVRLGEFLREYITINRPIVIRINRPRG